MSVVYFTEDDVNDEDEIEVSIIDFRPPAAEGDLVSKFIGIKSTDRGDDVSQPRSITIGLRPENARKVAAQILNAADEAQGETPLVFFPPSNRTNGEGDKPEGVK